MRIFAIAVCALLGLPLTAEVSQTYPPGTLQFFGTGALDAVAAPGGGVWVLTKTHVVKYTEAGPGSVYPLPGLITVGWQGHPSDIAVAPDGSLWIAKQDMLVHMSYGGAVLATYKVSAYHVAVAPNGVPWYITQNHPRTVGRIIAGVPSPVPAAPAHAWSLAFATNGDVWILPTGAALSGTEKKLYRMTEAGVVTTIPLANATLYGKLRTLLDGTVLIGRGINLGVLRFAPGAPAMDALRLFGRQWAPDASGNIWTGWGSSFGYLTWDATPDVYATMPHDVRLTAAGESCDRTAQGYHPLAVDSDGGVWVQVASDPPLFPRNIPCSGPTPVFPDLIRIDAAQFLAAHAHPVPVPSLSEIMMMVLAATLAGAAVWQMRG